ncbi:hypothetical protein C6988_02860 [Nitrosopumilus sp. b1]|uniref:hypothetical protein n=1 Tax=Nitrosopumilus sp. b1 TaxID=2109907 RepID=UPI0015F78313|nr:hypothetical protein [Nitrosopumilus sp. b1]KAF6243589.1 hypothetical protein C6988_02860 [Nitrosopumilus sp. b1]
MKKVIVIAAVVVLAIGIGFSFSMENPQVVPEISENIVTPAEPLTEHKISLSESMDMSGP